MGQMQSGDQIVHYDAEQPHDSVDSSALRFA